jgi:hypothetical protein
VTALCSAFFINGCTYPSVWAFTGYATSLERLESNDDRDSRFVGSRIVGLVGAVLTGSGVTFFGSSALLVG